jgi:hypothetical protein
MDKNKGISVRIQTPEYDREFGITTFPDRKRACLYLSDGGMIEPLAYFTTNEKAKRFKYVLERIVEVFEIHKIREG